jgi:mRNA-degrading endonuclease toxin of MazEF toxin-antitoxin module
MKNLDEWNEVKKQLDKREYFDKDFPLYFAERDIWFMSWGLNIGSEEFGKNERFERPALVLKRFNEKMMYAIPLTTQVEKTHKYKVEYVLNEKKFAAKINQMRLIDSKRLLRKVGVLDEQQFNYVRSKIKNIL